MNGHGSTAPVVALDVLIPSDVAEIEPVVQLMVERCRAMDLPQRACTLNIPVALSEALANAIVSGNHEDPDKHVRVRATVSPRELVVDVVDEGAGFDLVRDTHDATAPDWLEREDGRGLFLMRQLMDHVEQFRERGATDANVVRMVLRR